MASLPPADEHRALVKRINSSNYFLNKQLQHICNLNGMRANGVKAELQKRIIDALNKAYAEADAQTYRELEQSIYREKQGASDSRAYGAQQPPQNSHASSFHAAANHAQPSSMNNTMPSNYGFQHTNGHHGYGAGYSAMNGQRAQPASGMSYSSESLVSAPQVVQQLSQQYQQGPIFRHSPFYHVLERLGSVHVCEAMAQHRNSLTVQIKAQDHHLLSNCKDDKSLRVMVFCAASSFGSQDIVFPHQSELKVNGDEVKANLRGLKNKPGSTRPVDITDLLRLRLPQYLNNVEFTYALTNKAGDRASQTLGQRFYLVLNICRTVPVENLVGIICTKKISKASVILELTKKANDAEIELSSQVLSLKCPLSYMRLVTPVRATTCTHVQCFDATSYLQLQQQGPQWVCPVCSKPAPYDRLAVDEYVRDILDRTSKSVEQVDIQPDGEWKAHGPVEDEVKEEPQYDAFDLDDDDLVISEVSYVGNLSSTAAPTTGGPTPAPGASREGSSMPKPGGTKRAHEVIDLTLSDDDDEELPQPPTKRQQIHRPGSGLPSYF